MDNRLQQLEEDSTWLLVFQGQMDHEAFDATIRNVFHKLHNSANSPKLIVDLRGAAFPVQQDAKVALNVFIEELSAANFTTPIYYAFLSEDSALVEYATQLEAKGLQLPVVRSVADACTLFNLKVGYENLKQAKEHIYTQDVRDAEQASINLNNESTLPIERGTSRFPSNGFVKLAAVDSADTLLISPQTDVVLGRRSSEGVQPDIDLSIWGAYQNGVSRRHAKLLINSAEQLCLVELGSANGTYVNGQPLDPFQQYILHEFDTIRLGRLSMRITYDDVMKP